MKYDYEEKVIVVTGGAGGIGSHLAREFSERGAKLVLLDVNSTRLHNVLNSLTGSGHHSITLDLTDRKAIASAISEISKTYGRIDVLIPNAAITTTDRFDERSSSSLIRFLIVR